MSFSKSIRDSVSMLQAGGEVRITTISQKSTFYNVMDSLGIAGAVRKVSPGVWSGYIRGSLCESQTPQAPQAPQGRSFNPLARREVRTQPTKAFPSGIILHHLIERGSIPEGEVKHFEVPEDWYGLDTRFNILARLREAMSAGGWLDPRAQETKVYKCPEPEVVFAVTPEGDKLPRVVHLARKLYVHPVGGFMDVERSIIRKYVEQFHEEEGFTLPEFEEAAALVREEINPFITHKES